MNKEITDVSNSLNYCSDTINCIIKLFELTDDQYTYLNIALNNIQCAIYNLEKLYKES